MMKITIVLTVKTINSAQSQPSMIILDTLCPVGGHMMIVVVHISIEMEAGEKKK
jgi:hypothetical protein